MSKAHVHLRWSRHTTDEQVEVTSATTAAFALLLVRTDSDGPFRPINRVWLLRCKWRGVRGWQDTHEGHSLTQMHFPTISFNTF